jgi:hypothetical protein
MTNHNYLLETATATSCPWAVGWVVVSWLSSRPASRSGSHTSSPPPCEGLHVGSKAVIFLLPNKKFWYSYKTYEDKNVPIQNCSIQNNLKQNVPASKHPEPQNVPKKQYVASEKPVGIKYSNNDSSTLPAENQ